MQPFKIGWSVVQILGIYTSWHDCAVLITDWRRLELQQLKSTRWRKLWEKMKFEWKDMYFEFVPYRDTVCQKH